MAVVRRQRPVGHRQGIGRGQDGERNHDHVERHAAPEAAAPHRVVGRPEVELGEEQVGRAQLTVTEEEERARQADQQRGPAGARHPEVGPPGNEPHVLGRRAHPGRGGRELDPAKRPGRARRVGREGDHSAGIIPPEASGRVGDRTDRPSPGRRSTPPSSARFHSALARRAPPLPIRGRGLEAGLARRSGHVVAGHRVTGAQIAERAGRRPRRSRRREGTASGTGIPWPAAPRRARR